MASPHSIIEYRGWIPTVSGRLSYSVFGDNEHPTRTISANVADETERYLAAFQFRDASDVLLSKKLAPYLYGLDGRLWFAFLAKTQPRNGDPQHVLEGRAFLFSNQRRWADAVRPGIESYQEHLRGYIYRSNT